MTTVLSHEILAAFMATIFQHMPDRKPIALTDRFLNLSPAMRGCALIRDGEVLAATGDEADWGSAAGALFEAADAAAGARSTCAHVATEEGETYAVRLAGAEMVAVTDRFTLASLVLADMRATLREFAADRERVAV